MDVSFACGGADSLTTMFISSDTGITPDTSCITSVGFDNFWHICDSDSCVYAYDNDGVSAFILIFDLFF